jgi:hypothetical protein
MRRLDEPQGGLGDRADPPNVLPTEALAFPKPWSQSGGSTRPNCSITLLRAAICMGRVGGTERRAQVAPFGQRMASGRELSGAAPIAAAKWRRMRKAAETWAAMLRHCPASRGCQRVRVVEGAMKQHPK